MSTPGTAEPRVTVQGQATLRTPPDSAELTLTVQARDRRRDPAVALLAERQQALTDLLDRHRELVAEHSTDGLWVQAEHATDGSDRVLGHLASMTTRVRLDDVEAVGALVVAVAGLAGVSLYGPHWQLRPDSPAHTEVKALAVADAISRARGYATALGSTLTGLVEVRDAEARSGRAMPMAAMSAPEAAGPVLDVVPAPQEVHGRVEMTFLMSPPAAEVFLR